MLSCKNNFFTPVHTGFPLKISSEGRISWQKILVGAQNQYLASCLISGSSKKSVLLYDSSGKGKIIGMGTHQGLGARGQRARLAHMIAYCRHYKIRLGILVELFQILKDDAVKVLHSICQQILKSQQWPQDWKRSVFIPIPKKGNAKECSNYHAIALISHASKVMLKILQARLQNMWTMNSRCSSWF